LTLTTDGHKASRGLSAIAELIVGYCSIPLFLCCCLSICLSVCVSVCL